ncbi:MAG: Kelch repeat-containing protein [Bacteroidales bacterium]
MKNFTFRNVLFAIFLANMVLASCKKENSTPKALIGNWVNLYECDFNARSNAISFTVGDVAYVGLGYNETEYLTDFWGASIETNGDIAWYRLDNFPGSSRTSAVAFSVNGKGYVCTGYDGAKMLKDVWEYNPSTGKWTQKNNFGGTARYGAVAFTIGYTAYVCTGYDGEYLNDVWAYNSLTDTWTQKSNFNGSGRRDAVAFVIDGKGYICCGDCNGYFVGDFSKYDPSTDKWYELNPVSDISDKNYYGDYDGIAGVGKTAFAVGNYAYVATGGFGTYGNRVWEYDAVNDLWEEKTPFEGRSRMYAVSFVLGNSGYVLTGKGNYGCLVDIWRFDPSDEYDEYY